MAEYATCRCGHSVRDHADRGVRGCFFKGECRCAGFTPVPERIGFEDLERGINEAPITYLPALLVLVVKRCVVDKVFVAGGLQQTVAGACRQASGQMIDAARAARGETHG